LPPELDIKKGRISGKPEPELDNRCIPNAGTSLEPPGQARVSRSLGQSQGHSSKNAFTGDLPSIEQQTGSHYWLVVCRSG